MKLSYILGMLASGELGNLSLIEDSRLSIKPDKKAIVLRNINAGLNDLHTRFLLRRNIYDIPIVANESSYTILVDDFVEVLHVDYKDTRLSLGDDYILLDVNKIKFRDKPSILNTLSVEYKANHRVLTEIDIDLDVEVNLPMSYLNALLYFVASKLFTSIPNQLDGDLNEGVAYMRKFLEEIALLDRQGIDVDDLGHMDNFRSRGFV